MLLASCSTSDPDAPFGFAAAGPSTLTSQNSGFAPQSAPADGNTVAEFVMDEDDPSLPQAVAEAPSVRPVSAEEAAAQAQQEQAQQETPAQETAAAAPAPTEEAAQPQPAAEQQAASETAPQDSAATQQVAAAFAPVEQQPRKRGFLSSLFGGQSANAAPRATQEETPRPGTTAQPAPAVDAAPAKPIIQLASTEQAPKPLVASAASGGAALPGVRQNGLFEISRRSGLDDDSDIDVYEDEEPVQVASAAGLARLAPNGLMKQTEHVDVACLKPSLVRVLKAVERHYGRKMVVTSGYRSPDRNRRARGARNSLHMYCAAADVQVEGVSKWDLAQFVRTMPGRGGVGTYCHTNSVHIDVGPERDWNWRCRRRK